MNAPLGTVAPYNLEATVRVLQRRPTNQVDLWENDSYRRVLVIEGLSVLVRVANAGSIAVPALKYWVDAPDSLSDDTRRRIEGRLRRILGLDVAPPPMQRILRGESALQAVARGLLGMRPPRFDSLVETFVNVVPFQQVSLDAGAAVSGRVVQRFGCRLERGGRNFFAPPSAESLAGADPEALRVCGLSRRKADVLRDLAGRVANGELNEAVLDNMPTAQAMQVLRELPGIGPWSAALIMLRGMGRLDVFPHGDVGAAKVLGRLMQLDSRVEVEAAVERFGARKGYVYFYGLGNGLLAKGLIHDAAGHEF